MKNPEALTFRIPRGMFVPLAGQFFLYLYLEIEGSRCLRRSSQISIPNSPVVWCFKTCNYVSAVADSSFSVSQPSRWDEKSVPKCRFLTTSRRRVITQKKLNYVLRVTVNPCTFVARMFSTVFTKARHSLYPHCWLRGMKYTFFHVVSLKFPFISISIPIFSHRT